MQTRGISSVDMVLLIIPSRYPRCSQLSQHSVRARNRNSATLTFAPRQRQLAATGSIVRAEYPAASSNSPNLRFQIHWISSPLRPVPVGFLSASQFIPVDIVPTNQFLQARKSCALGLLVWLPNAQRAIHIKKNRFNAWSARLFLLQDRRHFRRCP